jgi:hypothetical protein
LFRRVCAVSIIFVALTAGAHADNHCANTAVEGKPVDGRFMGLPYAIIGHALAEKYCGAKHVPMSGKILGYVQSQGCGPGTVIYDEIRDSISKVESADLRDLATEGTKDFTVSDEEIQHWAKATSDDLGGCSNLVKAHDAEIEH